MTHWRRRRPSERATTGKGHLPGREGATFSRTVPEAFSREGTVFRSHGPTIFWISVPARAIAAAPALFKHCARQRRQRRRRPPLFAHERALARWRFTDRGDCCLRFGAWRADDRPPAPTAHPHTRDKIREWSECLNKGWEAAEGPGEGEPEDNVARMSNAESGSRYSLDSIRLDRGKFSA